jgi:ATP-dependent protease ClpP protease subunit
MAGALALLLGFGLAVSPPEARPVEHDEVSQCREWIQSHSQRPPKNTALTKILSPRTICFDGDIYPWTLKDAVAWADRVGTDRARRPRLVVRSLGGDADSAIDLAEKLQRLDAEVTVVDYCVSSCANYFFAGLRRRNVVSGALILFHGGFSAEERSDYADWLDETLRNPDMVRDIPDPAKWRADGLKRFDESVARQNALYRRIGVDPLVVTGMPSVDEQAIPAADCGRREGAPRSVLFFDMKQLRRLGIVIGHGKPSTDPSDADRRLSQFGFRFTACAVPDTYFSATSPKERPSR